MKRRDFMKMLSALPFVGIASKLFATPSAVPYTLPGGRDRWYNPLDDRNAECQRAIPLTRLEQKMLKELQALKLPHQCFAQYKVMDCGVKRCYDFAFPELRKAIEIDNRVTMQTRTDAIRTKLVVHMYEHGRIGLAEYRDWTDSGPDIGFSIEQSIDRSHEKAKGYPRLIRGIDEGYFSGAYPDGRPTNQMMFSVDCRQLDMVRRKHEWLGWMTLHVSHEAMNNMPEVMERVRIFLSV